MRAFSLGFSGLALLVGLALGAPSAAHAQNVQNEQADPAAMAAFYTQSLDCGGIVIRSSSVVDPQALQLACGKITMMLQAIPDVKQVMVQKRAEMHILGRSQVMTDLPEQSARRGKLFVDNRGHVVDLDSRGRGLSGGRFTVCPEDNILNLPEDIKKGKDTCIHEFAHSVMRMGFTDAQRAQIRLQYQNAMAAGLWKPSYADTNEKEYWAVLSMYYFGSSGEHKNLNPAPADGPQGLLAYDPQGFALLQSFYKAYR